MLEERIANPAIMQALNLAVLAFEIGIAGEFGEALVKGDSREKRIFERLN